MRHLTHAQRLCTLALGLALCGCGGVTSDRSTAAPSDAGEGGSQNNPPAGPQTCGADGNTVFHAAELFTFRAPCTWTGGPRQGIDSYVGMFTASGLEAHYDYGGYSSPLTELGDYPGHTKQATTIDGRAAYFVTAQDPEPSTGRPYLAGVHVPNVDKAGGTRLTMFGSADTAAKQKLLLDVFATIEFAAARP